MSNNNPWSIDHHKKLNERKGTPFGKKKSVIKKKARKINPNPLNQNKPVRFAKSELRERVIFIQSMGACQVCDKSYDLDYPHHALYGNGVKDDTSLVNICVTCHRIIHQDGYGKLNKTRDEIIDIGKNNYIRFESIEFN